MTLDQDLVLLGKILLAAALGGLIGFEREIARRPAGLRTHMLVAAAATLIVGLGHILLAEFEAPARVTTDPIRLIEAVIVGVSFIGAGTIFQRERTDRVEGLTTAASLLFTAALGITVALGQFRLALGAAALVLAIVWGLGRLERRINENRGG